MTKTNHKITRLPDHQDLDKAALRGEPSYVWRAGQERRLQMIVNAAEERISGTILENGCGVGMYIEHLSPFGGKIFGLEYDFERTEEAAKNAKGIINGAGENLPYPDNSFDLILSHEVIEHVQNDAEAIKEMMRVLKVGGRITLFVPNRGYPFETHGIYWRGDYRFGNKPFVNYLPRKWRDKLAPHVEIYTRKDLSKLFKDLPVKFIERTIIFGAYDNIIARLGLAGKILRTMLQFFEKTPLRFFGLSHFWVIEKTSNNSRLKLLPK
ncbi:MAG: class I SAM-dependent methyltransferase [Anaerolineae bacterium]|nr:class I SAM-dependent methyltransferase [Anaerolineae bacterium]MBT7075080.1 class I SAM-dependent methyltransferase [Anaerolineae bacterium]MBT7782275.1 class I SAM-dependent methyltransferase [Anaerolineae bacterium]